MESVDTPAEKPPSQSAVLPAQPPELKSVSPAESHNKLVADFISTPKDDESATCAYQLIAVESASEAPHTDFGDKTEAQARPSVDPERDAERVASAPKDMGVSVKTKRGEEAYSEFDYDVDFSEFGGSMKELLSAVDLQTSFDPSLAALAFADADADTGIDCGDSTVAAVAEDNVAALKELRPGNSALAAEEDDLFEVDF